MSVLTYSIASDDEVDAADAQNIEKKQDAARAARINAHGCALLKAQKNTALAAGKNAFFNESCMQSMSLFSIV